MESQDDPVRGGGTREWVREQNIWRYRARLTSGLKAEESALVRQLLAEEIAGRRPNALAPSAGAALEAGSGSPRASPVSRAQWAIAQLRVLFATARRPPGAS
jgi:hypothetical protein